MSDLVVGREYRTPWEPSGVVRVIELEDACWPYKPTAVVVFVGDHPNGYRSGTLGRYQQHELRPLTESEAERGE